MITDYDRLIANRFLDVWSKHEGEKYALSDGPDPPDFLLDAHWQETWLEVTGIYMNEAEGKFRNRPEGGVFRYCGDPAETPERLLSQLDRKLANRNYERIYRERGNGILLLSNEDCAFDEINLSLLDERLSQFKPTKDLGFFRIAFFEYVLGTQRFYGEVYPGKDLAYAGSAK